MPKYRFKLNSAIVDNPIDYKSLQFTLERQTDIRGILLKTDVPQTFAGDGYSTLDTAYAADLTDSVDVDIEQRCTNAEAWTNFYDGTIFLSDCKFNINKCLVNTPIEDIGYVAMIANNKNIKAYFDVARSKNDVAITAITPTEIDFFTPSTGNYDFLNRDCYSIFDCFEFLVDFMTDGNMDFGSTLFDAGGEFEDWHILTGLELREATALKGRRNVPFLSFQELFEEVDKRASIAFYVDNTVSPPKLWIEKHDDVFDSTISVTLSDVDDMERSVDTQQLYSRIDIGSKENQDDEGTFQWPDVFFFGHKEETYHLSGTNNVDAVLDLVGDWIVDSNVIEDILVTPNDEYDEDIVLVEVDTGAGQAIKFDLFNIGASPDVYNGNLTNQEIMPRHLRGIPNDVALFLGIGNDGFAATRTATTTGVGLAADFGPTLWDYDNEVSDPNANYDNTAGNYKYTAPADGFYRFFIDSPLTLDTVAPLTDWDLLIELRRYTAAAALVETESVTLTFTPDGFGAQLAANTDPNNCIVVRGTAILGNPTPFSIKYNPLGFYADNTDYFQVYLTVTTNSGTLEWELANGQFESSEVQTGGGVFQVQDPNDARLVLYKFQHPLSFSDFETINSNNRQMIAFTGANDGNTYKGWINKLSYRPEEGVADFELITSVNDQT